MSASRPGNGQYGGVLAGVKAKPYGWPTASLDTGSGHHPPATSRGQQESKSLQVKSPRNQGNPVAWLRAAFASTAQSAVWC
jgi:hypothetical protein